MKGKEMKTQYKYINFNEAIGWDIWECRNNKTNHCLGEIQYSDQWKCFVFISESNCQFSSDCLADIIDFMKQLK